MSARLVALVGLLGAVSLLAASCSGGAADTTRAGGKLSTATVPLTTSFETASGEWVVLPMGHLETKLNKFWEVLVKRAGSPRWSLDTPPGVADNGGFAVAVGSGSAASGSDLSSGTGRDADGDGTSVAMGFLVSNLLGFSPLAFTESTAKHWTTGVLPGSLTPLPGSFAGTAGHGYLALLGRRGSRRVAASSSGRSSWTTLTTETAVASSNSGRACRLVALTAVAVMPGGERLLGGSCRSGRVGLFELSGGSIVAAAPRLGRVAKVGTSVAAIDVSRQGAVVVVVEGRRDVVSLVERDGSWQETAALPIAPGEHLEELSESPGGEPAVLLAKGSEAAPRSEELVLLDGTRWQSEGSVPKGTQAVALAARSVTAFLVHDSEAKIKLRRPSGDWVTMQRLVAPILYGSSS